MAEPNNAVHTLIAALQERSISFKKAVIESDLNLETQYGRKNAQWVMEHLSPHTLLSKEEVALVRTLEMSGVFQTYTTHPALASTRPLDEDAIRGATASLKASTATYRKQTSVLRSQHASLDKFQAGEREAVRACGQEITALNRRHLLEKQRKQAMADDLIKDFESRLLLQQQQTHIDKGQFLQTVATKLRNDDRALADAERLTADLEVTEEDGRIEKRAMELVSTLSKLISEEVLCRLDRLYLETLLTGGETSGNEVKTEDQVAILEDDLQSLYSEIPVLAEMSARSEFGQRIRKLLQKSNEHMSHSLEDCLEMILHLLSEMTSTNSRMVDRLLHHQSRREALSLLSSTFASDMARDDAVQKQNKKAHRRQSSLGFGAMLQPHVPPERHQLQAVESILRRLGVSGIDPASSIQAGPGSVISERRSQAADLLHNLGTSAEMPLMEYLEPTDKAMELLNASLQSDSDFGLSLLDASQKERLADLERKLMTVQKGIEGVDLGVLVEKSQSRGRQFRGTGYS